MNNLKELALQYTIRKKLKGKQPERKSVNYARARHIGLLFYLTDERMYGEINRFVDMLRKDKKQVEALTLFDNRHENPFDFRYHFMSETDFQLNGKIREPKVADFVNQPFDLLFFVSRTNHLLFDYVLSASKALCRIGPFQEGRDQFFELMIHGNDLTEDILIRDMVHYTRIIARDQQTIKQQ